MKYFQSVLWRVRALFSRKLGVCPFCMRSAGLGTLLAWALYAAGSFAFPHRTVRTILLVAAVAFTTLMLAHIVAYVARVLVHVRGLDRRVKRAAPLPGAGLGRREFIDLALRASVYAIVFSLPGADRVFAGALPCEMEHNPFDPGANSMGARADVERGIAERAKETCDNYCADLTQHFGCAPGATCVQVKAPDVHKDCKALGGGQVKCHTFVKGCFCGCRSCNGEYVPIPPDDEAVGNTPAQMAADSAAKCTKLCEKLKNCMEPRVCYASHVTRGDSKHTGGKDRAPILKCKCECPP